MEPGKDIDITDDQPPRAGEPFFKRHGLSLFGPGWPIPVAYALAGGGTWAIYYYLGFTGILFALGGLAVFTLGIAFREWLGPTK